MVTLGVRPRTCFGLLHYPPTVSRRPILALLGSTVVVDVTYWTIWFTHRSWLASGSEPSYTDFENAFPLADGWLALCAVLAGASLLRRSPQALLWLIACGSAAAYLLGMDVLYDLEHGVWWTSGAEGWIELGVNAATALLAVTLLTWSWRHRDELQSR